MYGLKKIQTYTFNRQLLWSIRYLHVHGLIIFCLFLAHKGKANTERHKIYFRLICLLLPNLLLKVKSLELIYWLGRCSLLLFHNVCKKPMKIWFWRNKNVNVNNFRFFDKNLTKHQGARSNLSQGTWTSALSIVEVYRYLP